MYPLRIRKEPNKGSLRALNTWVDIRPGLITQHVKGLIARAFSLQPSLPNSLTGQWPTQAMGHVKIGWAGPLPTQFQL